MDDRSAQAASLRELIAANPDARDAVFGGSADPAQTVRPVRLQLSRRKGFDLQAVSLATNGLPAVNVARPSKWGSPFRVAHPGTAEERPMNAKVAVASFRRMIEINGGWFPVPLPWPKGKIPAQFTTTEDVIRELRGKNLACWCPLGDGVHCHADALLELANAPEAA